MARVTVVAEGLQIGEKTVPLHVASVHYWRLERRDWRPALRAVRQLGFKIVDLYIPWGVHETAKGQYDFGERDERLDVKHFLQVIHELGLYAIVRPGPHINGELTYFGIPERVVWDKACQAQTPRGNPVVLPMLPVAFPVPSYASEAFHEETEGWFTAVGKLLADLRYPEGPIVMIQVDNEGAMYFRDGAYDQDYHPDAISLFRRFLVDKYPTVEGLKQAYGKALDEIEPPTRFDAQTADELLPHLDWAEFHEYLLAWSIGRMARVLAKVGLGELPTSHNLPPAQETTPLNPARLAKNIDLVALDYYHRASPSEHQVIARRTTEMTARCEGRGVPSYAAEMGAGFPPFFPPLDETDSQFTVLCALAYGLRGFNIYMTVERDRWIGAPIDPHGRRRPFALFYERLLSALDRLQFTSLKRRVPVRLVTPRALRRMTRVMHAFGPVSAALFSVNGMGAKERCFEDHLGFDGPIALESDEFIRAFENALEGRGVPFSHVGGEDADVALDNASWVICATNGGMKPELFRRLVHLADQGVQVHVGPRAPLRNSSMRLLSEPPVFGSVQTLELVSPAEADRLVSNAIDKLSLPTYASDPHGIGVTVHEDSNGRAKIAFVMNPSQQDQLARVSLKGITGALDALDESRVSVDHGVLEVRLPPRTVRMIVLEHSDALFCVRLEYERVANAIAMPIGSPNKHSVFARVSNRIFRRVATLGRWCCRYCPRHNY